MSDFFLAEQIDIGTLRNMLCKNGWKAKAAVDYINLSNEHFIF